MLFQQINRSDAEKVFGIYTATAALIAEQTACLDLITNVDGYHINSAVAAGLDVCVGIVDAAIAVGGVGLVQVYGYRATSIVLVSTVSYAAGVKMVPVDAKTYLAYVAAADGRDGHFAVMESIASFSATTTASKKIFIHAM